MSNDPPTSERRLVPYRASSPELDDVRRRARHRLQTEGVEVGVETLIELAQDKKQKGSTRGAAAKALVHSGGATGQMLTQEDLAEMPAEQIRAMLVEAQRALTARLETLKTIDHEPTLLNVRKNVPPGNVFD